MWKCENNFAHVLVQTPYEYGLESVHQLQGKVISQMKYPPEWEEAHSIKLKGKLKYISDTGEIEKLQFDDLLLWDFLICCKIMMYLYC